MSTIERVDRVALSAAALVWVYLVAHYAHTLGIDWPTIWSGPHDLLHGVSPYPTSSTLVVGGPMFYAHPPSAPVLLAPLGLLPVNAAGAVFVTGSALVFAIGLYRLGMRTPFPGLIMLGAGLALPVRDETSLGNADLLCAGLIALAFTTGRRTRTVALGLAMAVKPTAWPILVLFGWETIGAVAIAASLDLVGLATLKHVGRFFHHVIPWLAHGQQTVAAPRASLTDAAVAAGLPHGPVSVVCLVVLIACLVWVRLQPGDRARWAPLVMLLALLLSSYTFVPYAVYLIAVIPLLTITPKMLPLAGVALYLVGTSDVLQTSGLPHSLNTAVGFNVLAGLVLLLPIALTGQVSGSASRA